MSPTVASLLFWIAALSCAVAHGALIRSALRDPAGYPEDRRKQSRRGGIRWGPDRRSDADQTPARSSRELEIGWAVLPALALAGLLTATWLALPD